MTLTLDHICGHAITRAEAVLPKLQDAPSIILLESNIARARAALREGDAGVMRIEANNLRAWIRDLENA